MCLQKPLLERLLHECPEVTGANELFQVIAVMSALAKESDMPLLQAFSGGLSPSVLADVVMANLDHLPQREDVEGAKAASSGTGALASLMQVSISVAFHSYSQDLLLLGSPSIASSVGYTCTLASARNILATLHCHELIVWAGDHRVKQI